MNAPAQVPRPLTTEEQQEYLRLMRIGAPPLAACERMGISFADVIRTADLNGRCGNIE